MKKDDDIRPFYVNIESVVLFNKDLTNTDKIIYGIIAAFSMNSNGYCYLRYSKIAQYACIKKRNLYICLQKLIDKQYIQKIVKGDRVYLMPTTNAFIQMREHRKIDKDDLINNYDWLND